MQYWVEQQTGGHIATNSSFLAKTEDSHLSSPWARYISCISLNYVNFLLKQPLLHEIHDLLAFHYLKELIFQETTISLSKGAYFSRNHHIVDKSQYLIICLIIGCTLAQIWYRKPNYMQIFNFITFSSKFNDTSISKAFGLEIPLEELWQSRRSHVCVYQDYD